MANNRHAWLHDCAVRAMGKEFKLIYDVGDSGSKKHKRCCGGACCGIWRSVHLAGAWSQVTGVLLLLLLLLRFAGIRLQSSWMSSCLICSINKFYKCYSLNANYKDDVATVQLFMFNTKVLFQSTSTGHGGHTNCWLCHLSVAIWTLWNHTILCGVCSDDITMEDDISNMSGTHTVRACRDH
jgi:hypothetical protein